MSRFNRRTFLQRSSQSTALLTAASALKTAHCGEKTAPVRLGIIGCGGIMERHVKGLASRGSTVSIEWLCDVDPRQMEKKANLMHAMGSPSAKHTSRFEDVLADDKVNACVIATPNHWHAPIALAAIQAGKDVYLEKPFSHVYAEGSLLAVAAQKHGRIIQHGTQMRSSPVSEKAGRLLRDGIIGEIKVARVWTAENREVRRPVPDSEPPAGVDYDRWLGPAPKRPFNPLRFHESWRFFRDYSNGEIGDDGIHDLDMATWGLGVTSLPHKITARGGRMLRDEHASEFPDNLTATYEYPDGGLIIYENYAFTPYGMYGFDNGNVFYGTKGYMIFSRRGAFSVFHGAQGGVGPTEGKELRGQLGYEEHMTDFLEAVRQRRPTAAPPEIARRSTALVHLAEIALQTRGSLEFDPTSERFRNCDEADALLTKTYRHPWHLTKV